MARAPFSAASHTVTRPSRRLDFDSPILREALGGTRAILALDRDGDLAANR